MSVTELMVTKEVTVAAPVERAFAVFTEKVGSWWPLETFAVRRGEANGATFEGHEGGRFYERTPGGEEVDWGRVLVWEPPTRIVFTWANTEPATEVEVRFRPDGGSTVVELEHRGWERFGARPVEERAGYESGWDLVLGRYVEAAGR